VGNLAVAQPGNLPEAGIAAYRSGCGYAFFVNKDQKLQFSYNCLGIEES
jgi:hypothetical protein